MAGRSCWCATSGSTCGCPSGVRFEAGETPLEAARRELREETGLDGVFPTGLGVDGTPPGLIGYEEHPAGSKGLHMNFAFVADVATRDPHRLRRVHRRALGRRSGPGRMPAERPTTGAPRARRRSNELTPMWRAVRAVAPLGSALMLLAAGGGCDQSNPGRKRAAPIPVSERKTPRPVGRRRGRRIQPRQSGTRPRGPPSARDGNL